MELFIFARFHAREGEQDAVVAAMRAVVAPTRAEPGCRMVQAHCSIRDPRLFHIHSRWADEAAFERHAQLSHTMRFLETMRGLVDQPIEVSRAQPFA